MGRKLVGAESDEGIHPRGAQGGDKAGERGDEEQHDGVADEGERIGGGDAVEKRLEQAREHKCADESDPDAEQDEF